MKLSIVALSVSAFLAFGSAAAIVPAGSAPAPAPSRQGTPPPVSQQDRLAGCNASAVRQHLTGDPLNTFMASCMKGS
jgi:hypothetical protein